MSDAALPLAKYLNAVVRGHPTRASQTLVLPAVFCAEGDTISVWRGADVIVRGVLRRMRLRNVRVVVEHSVFPGAKPGKLGTVFKLDKEAARVVPVPTLHPRLFARRGMRRRGE